MKLIQKSGNSYAYGEIKLGRGYDATRQYLRENKKLTTEILKEIKTKLKEGALNREAPAQEEKEEEPEE